jgi:ADP-heptose:LPS heptosyltransferase
MGIGDEIMVSGEVRNLVRKFGVSTLVRIAHPGKGMGREHDIWKGNPHIAAPDAKNFTHTILAGGGLRPYIRAKQIRNWLWKPYTPTPGEIYLTPHELSMADHGRGAVVIQPTIKDSASPNKLWRLEYWEALVASAPELRWLQVGDGLGPRVRGAEYRLTTSFREACGVMLGARAAVLHEGGLHHAAAALGVPAVVIFGGFISPECTGYNLHRNMYVESREHHLGCGMRVSCTHCEMAMRKITPRDVRKELEVLLCRTT